MHATRNHTRPAPTRQGHWSRVDVAMAIALVFIISTFVAGLRYVDCKATASRDVAASLAETYRPRDGLVFYASPVNPPQWLRDEHAQLVNEKTTACLVPFH